MSITSRIRLFLNIRGAAALNRAEDPREVLDYACEQQRALLLRVRRGLLDVATARRRLEQQLQRRQAQAETHQAQARQALELGRDELAREALQRKQDILAETDELRQRIAEVAARETEMRASERRLAARVEAFGSRRELLSATYTAAEAQVAAGEALAGCADESLEVEMAVRRAEERTEHMAARAGALDILAGLDDRSDAISATDAVGRELRQLGAAQRVEDELAALRASLTDPGRPTNLSTPPDSPPASPSQ